MQCLCSAYVVRSSAKRFTGNFETSVTCYVVMHYALHHVASAGTDLYLAAHLTLTGGRGLQPAQVAASHLEHAAHCLVPARALFIEAELPPCARLDRSIDGWITTRRGLSSP